MTATNESANEAKLVEYLRRVTADLHETRQRLAAVESASGEPVAIIGMSCRYPGGANTVEQYWQKLLDGLDAVREVPADRWDAAEIYAEDRSAPGKAYTQRAGFVDDVAGWDAEFFGLSPQEARRLDPQHRLLMELVWEGLEDAGLAPDRLRGTKTGVFVGLIDSQWVDRQSDAEGRDLVNDPYVALGSAQGASAGRIAYHFDLRGPTLTIDTACSSSLVATHLAVQSLRRGECDVAVVAASSAILHPNTFIAGCKMNMLASDGRSKAFDESGDGYGLGEGGGIVVLQRASDATSNDRRVHALIRGSAVNQDGRSNGLTAPNKQAQVALLRSALTAAGVGPDDLDLLEAHGTGTALGDAIEFSALLEVFGGRVAEHPLLVGAVKTNIGHLHAASGLAGLIKSVLALKHGEVPGNLHLDNPISVVTSDGPVQPIRQRQALRRNEDQPRRAGVSSFGWSGTNGHVVIEQAPEAPRPAEPDAGSMTASLLTLSADRPESLARTAAALADHLESTADIELADIAYTTQTGRSGLRYRRALPCADVADAVTRLRRADVAETEPVGVTKPVVGMVFPAASDDVPGLEFYETQQAFRAAVDECAELVAGHGIDLREVLSGTGHRHLRAFVHGYALAATLGSLGVSPTVVSGTGAGEQVAELVAGRYGLADALRLVRCHATGQDPAAELASIEPRPPRITVVDGFVGIAEPASPVLVAGADAETPGPVVPLLDVRAALGRLWELGVAVDWPAAWPTPRRVADLPTYSFERTRFWPELGRGAVNAPRGAAAPRREEPVREVRCHAPSWRRHDAMPPVTPAPTGTLLVFGADDEPAESATAAGHRVVRVAPGDRYARTGDTRFTIDITDPEHYRLVLTELDEEAGPLRVVHTYAGTDTTEAALDSGFYSLLWLSQAIGQALPDRPVELVAATAGVFDVLGGDARNPVQATVSGLCRGIDAEYPNIRCRSVDLDTPVGASTSAAALLREVELLADDHTDDGVDGLVVAWRRGRRWQRTFTEVAIPAGTEPERAWRPGGSYLITGGLRGLGLSLAQRLAPLGTKLTLVGRTELPPEPRWDDWLAEHGPDDEISTMVLAVRALRDAGAEVLPLAADVCRPDQVDRAIRTARDRFGELHGVVHAAGVSGGERLANMTGRQAAEVLAPKIGATLAIADALRDDPPELLVLYSSAIAALGRPGETDHGAASCFLDAFAASDALTEKVATRVVSVGWGPWRQESRQSGPVDAMRDAHLRQYREDFGITVPEGADVLAGIVTAGPAHVVVLTQPFADAAERVAALATVAAELDAPAAGPKYPRPDLRTPYLAPRTDTERRIAVVWQDFLGIEEIGVHDPFFEIGGTSMIGLGVVNRLNKDFGIELAAASVFERPTVAELAATIAEIDPRSDSVPEIASAPRRRRRGPGSPERRTA
ncbi:MAG: SDR family oxidoreductase [Actinophytocola sp.]|uniref:type I polyketide synthase n=1 Tax=Actinophytocola sp. TaxID=1872138 RepID=UPI003D6C2493